MCTYMCIHIYIYIYTHIKKDYPLPRQEDDEPEAPGPPFFTLRYAYVI